MGEFIVKELYPYILMEFQEGVDIESAHRMAQDFQNFNQGKAIVVRIGKDTTLVINGTQYLSMDKLEGAFYHAKS